MTAETFAVTLTERQRDVARLYDAGYSRADIARAIGIGPRTVKHHLEQVALRLPGAGTLRVRIARYLRPGHLADAQTGDGAQRPL